MTGISTVSALSDLVSALMKFPLSNQHGFGLIEVCVVMAVAAVLATLAAPSFQDLIAARRLEGAATQLATDLQFIRTEAVARNQALRLSVYESTAGSCYVLHSGAHDNCDCAGNEGPAQCSGAAQEIKTVRFSTAQRVALQANVASLLFDPVHGTSTPSGTLRVVGQGSRAIHQVVNVMGRVRSCSPEGAVAGYRAC
jgi:type IV fimbrial biogenesis protein FimT